MRHTNFLYYVDIYVTTKLESYVLVRPNISSMVAL